MERSNKVCPHPSAVSVGVKLEILLVMLQCDPYSDERWGTPDREGFNGRLLLKAVQEPSRILSDMLKNNIRQMALRRINFCLIALIAFLMSTCLVLARKSEISRLVSRAELSAGQKTSHLIY